MLPNKNLGQHWLDDQATLDAICDLAEIAQGDTVLEIGPGLGSLTSRLLKTTAASVIAIELDLELAAGLEQRLGSDRRFKLIMGDIRSFNLNDLPTNYRLVANIPYYLSSYLIRLISESANPPSKAVLLVQKEVAERLAAAPGQLSLLGLMAQLYWRVELGPVVRASMFNPPPKVDSQVVILSKRENLVIPAAIKKLLLRIIKIAFAQKRKTLVNSLSAGLGLTKDQVSQILDSCGLNTTARPQELSIEEWIALCQVLVKAHSL